MRHSKPFLCSGRGHTETLETKETIPPTASRPPTVNLFSAHLRIDQQYIDGC